MTIWDYATRKQLKTLEVYDQGQDWIEAMEFSPDGETLYCASHNNLVTAQRWRANQSQIVYQPPALPWKMGLTGVFVWLVAWRWAPRLPKQCHSSDQQSDACSAELTHSPTS